MEVRYSITLHPLVTTEDIPRLDTFWRHEIRDAVRAKLTIEPELYGKPLRQALKGHRSLRVENYRVVYRIEKRVVKILAIVHRSSKYKGIEKRI